MAVEPINVAPNSLGTEETTSVWSPAIWDGMKIENLRAGSVNGAMIETYFNRGFKPSTNVNAAEAYWDQGWMAFGSDGAPIATTQGTGLAGGITISSDGDNEGASLRHQFTPFKISRATKDLAFEAAIQTSTIADTKHGFFLGLIEDAASTATAPIAAAGTLTDLNFVGYHRLEGDGDYVDAVYKANTITQVTTLADAHVLVAATQIRLGFRYRQLSIDPELGLRYILRFIVNGVPIATAYKQIPSTDGDDFPNDINLGPIFCVLNATGSTPGTSTIHRIRVAQLTA